MINNSQSVPIYSESDQLIKDHQQEAISGEQIHHLLIDQVLGGSKKTRKLLDRIVFDNILFYNAYTYELTSLVEYRIPSMAHRPYSRQVPIDGYNFGPPDIQEMKVPPPDDFVHQISSLISVPHTDEIKPCKRCQGQSKCDDEGTFICSTCHDSGCVVWFKLFKCLYQPEVARFITGRPVNINLCDFLDTGSVELFYEMGTRVTQLTHGQFNDTGVIDFAQRATGKEFDSGVILKQKQKISAIPVVAVAYSVGRKSGTFYICGTKRIIHFPKNNGQRCSIM